MFFLKVFAKLLDPVGFILVFVISLLSRQKWIIPVAAIVAAVVTESVLTANQMTRSWGQGIIPGVVASGIQAVLCYWSLKLFRKVPSTNDTNQISQRENETDALAPDITSAQVQQETAAISREGRPEPTVLWLLTIFLPLGVIVAIFFAVNRNHEAEQTSLPASQYSDEIKRLQAEVDGELSARADLDCEDRSSNLRDGHCASVSPESLNTGNHEVKLGHDPDPSFFCDGVLSRTEAMICADRELRTLDRTMAQYYRDASTGDNAAPTILESQRHWLRTRDQCDSTACLRETYAVRISELEALMHSFSSGVPSPDCIKGVTRIDMCAKARQLSDKLAAMLPLRMNKNMAWESVMSGGTAIQAHIRLSYDNEHLEAVYRQAGVSVLDGKQALQESAKNICQAGTPTRAFVDLGGTFRFVYLFSDGKQFTTAVVNTCT